MSSATIEKKSLRRVHKIQTLTWILEIKTVHVCAGILQQFEYIFILTEMR